MAVQHTGQHHPIDTDMRSKGGHAHAQIIKPAGQQFARVCGVVHVHDVNRRGASSQATIVGAG